MKMQTQAEVEKTLGDQYGAVKAKIEGFLQGKDGKPEDFMRQYETMKNLVKGDPKKIEAFISLQALLAEQAGEGEITAET